MASGTTSRLLGLPPELRNRIYEFVFENSEVKIRGHWNGIPCSTYQPPSLGILMACRQTYREATDIFYSVTTFYFTWRMALVEFLRSLPPRHARMVSTVRFDTIARLEFFKSTGTGIAVAAQYDVFTAHTSLKKFACPIPASIQSNVADFSRSSGYAKWTSTPWMTFAELYVQFPGITQSLYDDHVVCLNTSFFKRAHFDYAICWYHWTSHPRQTCDCPYKDDMAPEDEHD